MIKLNKSKFFKLTLRNNVYIILLLKFSTCKTILFYIKSIKFTNYRFFKITQDWEYELR